MKMIKSTNSGRGREAWCTAVHRVAQSQTRFSYWITTRAANMINIINTATCYIWKVNLEFSFQGKIFFFLLYLCEIFTNLLWQSFHDVCNTVLWSSVFMETLVTLHLPDTVTIRWKILVTTKPIWWTLLDSTENEMFTQVDRSLLWMPKEIHRGKKKRTQQKATSTFTWSRLCAQYFARSFHICYFHLH